MSFNSIIYKESAEDHDENGKKKISKKYLKELLKQKPREYYGSPHLNDVLYLHFKGFNIISNLEEFTGLKSLYLEGNAIQKIQGLEALTELKQLCLQQNCIQKIEGLEKLENLVILNLSENFILEVENLESNKKLETLQLKSNKIGLKGLKGLEGLLKVQSLKVLDISDNKIKEESILEEILQKLENLKVLYLQGNEVCSATKNYRKKYIYSLINLKFLDEMPIFQDERKFAQAFQIGGIQQERKVRKQDKEDKEREMRERVEKNKPMVEKLIAKYKRDVQKKKEQEQNYKKQLAQQNNQQNEDCSTQISNSDNIPELEDMSKQETKQEQFQAQNNELDELD
ncbi:hypothetical protein PPERSA_06882 [Pseudocohnilembus persalinus]|uniref:Uncharacterized protein n=1 Tax=Pseudocohnilembus persalinus TaxID=266149 RepID=A0A0V0QY41_PSEPJ|nr:hypothetical protein PPERSA_06882 [Pseudocohnilembus persalinus]|eukprot:KRX07267.1 hypothetical protein PPERSA_06882 [Pseudocohnilembus persalinus]